MPSATPLSRSWSAEVTKRLLAWFGANARDLPWRLHYTPYEVWVSEIMLQQTQMLRVVDYFKRFMSRFPTLQSLAQADLEAVLCAWEGLGYYQRAKNLHKTARLLLAEYGGQLPTDQEKLEKLPGIGHYTAGAIAAIAFEQPTVGVDANGLRVLARLFDCCEDVRSSSGKICIERYARALLPEQRARDFNQALMEFGALICGRKLLCADCPLQDLCLAHAHGTESQRPVQMSSSLRQLRYSTAGVIIDGKRRLLLCQRPKQGIWANLWTLPEFEMAKSDDPTRCFCSLFARQTGLKLYALDWQTQLQHSYTKWQIVLQVRAFFLVSCVLSKPFVWFARSDLAKLPLPSPHRTVLDRFLTSQVGKTTY
ncbi:MAG: A/G-specific adenine glycosylase [Desulfovibrio sp.]|nr:A/G-specific adenine glycosylase [Desulfovibrio sp.]